MLKVGTRSAIVIDMEGKEIGRGSGYKMIELSELEDGGRLGVGAKEVEVTGESDAVTWDKMTKVGEMSRVQKMVVKMNNRKEKEKPPEMEISTSAITSPTVNKFKPFKVPV